MVRFHWHVEGGLSAFIAGPQSVVSADGEEKIYELPCYIELAGQKETFEGLINVRSGHFGEGRVQPVGVALAHDTDVATARGKVVAKLALELAKAGGLSSLTEEMSVPGFTEHILPICSNTSQTASGYQDSVSCLCLSPCC